MRRPQYTRFVSIRAQYYSRIEEFGEEAESRVLAVEGELESSLQEVDKLQAQIAEYEEEMR